MPFNLSALSKNAWHGVFLNEKCEQLQGGYMDLREAAKQALEVLIQCTDHFKDQRMQQVIDDLKRALAEKQWQD